MTVSAALAVLPMRGAYARFLRRVAEAERTDPTVRVSVPIHFDGYFGHCRTVADVVRENRRALHRRINLRGGIPESYGRRDTYEGRISAYRDSRVVLDYRTRRVVRHGSGFETAEARARFPDIQARMREPFDA